MEKILRSKLGANRSKHLPPIKRGSQADIYLTSSGQMQIQIYPTLFMNNIIHIVIYILYLYNTQIHRRFPFIFIIYFYIVACFFTLIVFF